MVRKDPDTVRLRMVLCYPDVYEVGMSHVGSHILYHIANLRPDTYCERAFYPQTDAVQLLRQHGLRLCALESGDPLAAFDVVGITLQHELTYATVLGLLDLGGIPLLASERGDDSPLVVGGGPGAYNPEPLAPFFDAFVIGDGEEVLEELLEEVGSSRGLRRRRRLERLAELTGVYVPAVHDPLRDRIQRRIVRNLDAAPYPTAPVVPYLEVVHDRAQIEVARGCTRGCRFCQAGIIYRPVRERTVQTLRQQAQQIIGNTGYDEVSLVSLNCPDHTGIAELVDSLHEDLGEQRVSIGLPSLRTDTFSVSLAQRVSRVRKSGLTFAPEAGSQRLRDAINKGVTDEDLLTTAEAAFAAGWHTLKLYFMIGLPTETDQDVGAIAELVRSVARRGREVLGARAGRLKLNVSVSNFVPKAHTPLQWDGQIPRQEMRRRQKLIVERLRDRQVSVACHDDEQSTLEAALARGDRRTAQAILEAYRAGACLDAWRENLDFDRWQAAFARAGLSLDGEATKTLPLDADLPWEHIRTGVSREFLLAERQRMLKAATTPDCRLGGCVACGLGDLCAGAAATGAGCASL